MAPHSLSLNISPPSTATATWGTPLWSWSSTSNCLASPRPPGGRRPRARRRSPAWSSPGGRPPRARRKSPAWRSPEVRPGARPPRARTPSRTSSVGPLPVPGGVGAGLSLPISGQCQHPPFLLALARNQARQHRTRWPRRWTYIAGLRPPLPSVQRSGTAQAGKQAATRGAA
jgi:hypothetical protein